MRLLVFYVLFLSFSGIVSAMEKHVPQEITQPSDLFGREILPECTFESEYGKLTLGRVVVPDFSSDEKGSVRLKEEFDNLKSFIAEKELSRKLGIAERVHGNEFSAVDPLGYPIISNYASRSSGIFSKFTCTLMSSTRARAFELGIYSSVDICDEFGYDKMASLSSGIILYNDSPVVQPLSCGVGMYVYGLRCILNPRNFCVYEGLLERILTNGLPTHNYLSWACSCASGDKEVERFVADRRPDLCFGER